LPPEFWCGISLTSLLAGYRDVLRIAAVRD
jgi:hypothetical protein